MYWSDQQSIKCSRSPREASRAASKTNAGFRIFTIFSFESMLKVSKLSKSRSVGVFLQFFCHFPFELGEPPPTHKKRFFLEKTFPDLWTHPPTPGFCEIWENERWNSGRKGRFSGWFGGVLRGLDLVWESATPPTHIWERSPKKTCFFTPSLMTWEYCIYSCFFCILFLLKRMEMISSSFPRTSAMLAHKHIPFVVLHLLNHKMQIVNK